MYNLDQTVSEESSGNYFSVGIQEDVSLKDVTMEEAANGNNYLKFHFEGSNGEKLSHTEWPITPDDQNFEKKMKNLLIRMKHICTKFVEAEKININGESFQDFCDKVIALLVPNLGNTKVRIKLVYNYRNYVSLPKYVPFIEKMSVDKGVSKLKLDPGFDKLEKDEGTDPVLTSTTNEPVVSPTGEESGDPLPF